MKKNSRLKSFFAILLAVSMIFQQSSLTVLATDDTYVEDATATPTPSESEAEAYATEGTEPVAEKQEEPQQMQETPAAEQAQEPTEAPAEQPTEAPTEQPTEAPAEQPTEAPAEQPTEAPAAAPTETPATEPTAAPAAEVTEAPAAPEATATPAAEATATPTPEVSASPSETPTPTEAPKTSFRYEDSRVVITATAPEDANLQQDAEIKADYIAPGTDRYNAAVAAFNSQLSSQLGLDAENTEAEYVLYDVYFLTADGSRIEPESGNVKVDMSFKKIQESTVDGDVVNKNVVHLDNDGQAEVVTEYVNTNADGEITSMGFTQDSFSIVGGVTTYDVETSGGEGNSENALKLDAYITNVIIQDANQQTITSLTETTTESKRTESFNLVGYFGNIPVDELEKHGWKVEYQIPEQDKIKLEEPTSGTIKNGSNEVIGNYRITTDGFVSMEFDKDKLGHGTAVGGNFTCWAYLDCTDITTTGDVTLKFNDKVENNVTIRVIKKEQLEIKKVAEVPVVNYENNEITYTYTVKVSSPTGTVKSIDFVDKLEKWSSDANLSWSSLTIECNDPLVSVASDCLTISTENKTISGTLPCLSVGEFYTITYKITEKFNEPVNGKFSENNTAKAKTNPSGKLEDLIEVEAKSNPEVNYTSKDYKDVVVDKKGTGVQGDDGKITWTYTVTVSSPHGTGDEIDFKDQLKSDAKGTSRKVKSDSLSVKKKTNTAPDGINVTSENYLKVSGDELLKADSIAVSGKLPALNAGESYEITYQVEESGFTESNFTANGKNTAYAKVTEKVKDEHSSEPTIYYGIPNLNKNGNYDAENNKVNWTIEVNNNFASLEGYEVSDILLQNDIQQNADIIAKVTIQKTGWLDVKLVDDVKLPIKFYTDSNGKPCMEDAAGKVTELYTIRDFIKIEYSTMVPDDNNYYVKYNNTANIEKGGENKGESKKDVDAIKPIVTKDDAIVTENKDSDAVNLAWTTSITIPADGIKVGSYFEDYLENPWSGSEPKLGSWFTKEQLDSMTVTGINKSDYIITYIQTENNANYFKGFKITFNKAISYSEVKQISLSYSSTGYVGNLKAGEKKEFVNEAKFTQDGKQTTDKGKGLYSKESTGPKVDKENLTEDGSVKDAFYSCDNSKKIRIYYRVVIDTESLTENIVYEDVFPNYGTLVTSDWKYDGKECDSNNSRKGIIVRYLSDTTEADNLRGVFGNLGFDYYAASRMDVTESKTGSFTITVDKDAIGIHSNGNWFAPYGERPKLVLYYAIDYDLNSVGLTDRNDCVITNNGTVSSGGKSDSSSATATVEMSKVSKSSAGYHDDTNTISYAVTINPAGEEVLDGNNLTVTDTLNYTDHVNDIKGISLIPGSAKLYRRNADGSKGEDITPNGGWISVTDANGICTLVASVPDKTACILEYKYLFEYKNISRKDYLISNTAVVSGEANKKWTSTVSTQLKDQGSDVIANTESTMLTLVKRDSQNAALFLEGAVYKLEKYNGTKWVTVGENYTTDKNGVVQLGEEINGKIVMKYNYAYRLTEIKAPNNYKCASEPIYIYLKEASSSVSYKPTGFDESKALGSNGGYIYVSDEKDLTEKISIPVEKRWDDANNKEGFRPSKITVVLIKNGTETKTTLELTADNDWKGEFSKLDKFDSAGDLISYGIKEIEVNYYPKPDVTGDATKGFVVTNKRTPEMVDISVSKSWDDSNNQDGKRVGEVEVQLYADGCAVAGKVLKLNEGNGWKGTFIELDKYQNGKKISYTVKETTNVDGYTASVSGNAEEGYVVTNQHTPDKVNIPVSKSWDDSNNQDGKRVGEVEVQLYADGSAVAGKVLKLNEGNGWKGTFQDLDKYKKGQEIKYTVVETTNVDGYTASVSGSAKDGYVITNIHTPESVNIEGTKTWNDNGNADIRPETITINLYANKKLVASKTVTKTDDWKWKFADQPKYEKGQEIEYTITEDKVDGYITAQGIGNYDVVNTPTTVTVDKVDDEGNPVKNAKLQISVKDDNGNVVASWKTDDTSYDIIGKLIAGNTYTLEEINVPTGYVAADPITFKVEADGTITVDNKTIVGNKLTLVDAKLHFNVNKVELGNGKEVEGAHLVVIDKETGKTVDEWVSEKGKTHDFGPKLEAGKSYILRETVAPAGYKYATDIEFTVKKDGTIETNAKTTTDTDGNKVYLVEDDTTKVTITKVDALGNQLSGVVLEIQDKDGVVIDSWTTSTKDNPRVITGKLILGETYKLVEKSAPAGYTLADPVEFTVSENDIDNKVEMKNTYSASGSLNLTAKKTLTTTETPLTEGQFTFELRDKDGTVLQTKTNDADGNVTFDEIKYSLVKDNTDKKVDDTGEYQYTVNEVKGDAAGYTYDDTIYTINATVTDAGNGTLTVTPVIHSSKATSEDATVTGMEFTNTYTTSGQIALGATKTLEGQTLEAEQFSFQATEMDADGKAVENGYNETVKNADGGTITFPIITYKESGTHYYQITEVKDEKPAYQYDERKYVVKVDVTDDNAGKLTAKVTSVTKNGEPVKSEDLTGAVTFTNTYSASADLELKAQKSMKVEAEQLGTFEFELKDADGKVIETVKNDEKGAISFSKLSYTEKDAGKTFTYTVNEKLPSEADTYVYDKTVYTVTVNVEDNRDGTLKLTTKVNGEDYTETAMKFVNDTTKVTISKVDDTTLKALAGAKLQVVDDQDKVVEEWTSDGTPHVITAKLVLGKTYKLVEAEAPSGYEIAEPITFTVDADDTKNAVEMKDAMTKSKTAAIEITKELKLNDALAGAKDMTFYAALFADAECTIPASDVKALEFKNASSSTVTFTNLDLGRTYYVSETDVTGKAIDSGMTPDEKVYVPVYPQGQAITVTEDGAKSSITFENQFSEWPDGFYKIATLNVTKKLLGADGNALESDEIFYAGIFDDKECTTLSTRTEKNILTLDLAGGSTVSESTQAVVIPDEAFTLYVAETDAEGNLVDGTDGFRYAVTVENGNVLFDENNLNAEVTIINQKQPEATPTVTPEETITPTPTPGTSTGVKTGDDTPIGFYMALFFVAALAIEETTRRRRKKEQD
ncbi:Cna B-type domain-containing protein [Ruminococcus sp. 1001136sp1]|uniref:Cna B-type domain-containing protein n=4 Tax=Bacillota TaxID=1239 RepID=UPI00232FBC9C|nr:Cna B-type domain-containing protein [Ruminococcus sp. 1001136sp1]MDB8758588.1 Cna B-type domain-containing protein [Ruminococcus sp. 1001136sp1]